MFEKTTICASILKIRKWLSRRARPRWFISENNSWEGDGLKNPGKHNSPRVAIYTLGCKVNQFESACLLERFQGRGWEAVSFKEKADFYLINTCAVTAEAQRQSAQMVRQTIRNHPDSLVVAAGCAAQLFPHEYEKISGLDYITGTFKKLEIPFNIPLGAKTTIPQLLLTPEPVHTIEAQFPRPDQRTRATIRIQEGCNAQCSYCLVPRARGRSRSLWPKDIISGVESLAAQGIKEVILTGIHLGQYGEDLCPQENLVCLLETLLSRIPEVSIRLSSLEPQEVTPALLALFKKYPNLCPHLHIPLQAGEDSLLKKMNRSYSTDFYHRLIRTIHREMPFAAIGADLIIGFPGEDEALFQKTVELITDLPLSYLHIFPYSRRPGTPAADFPHPVLEKVKKERIKTIRALDRQKKEEFWQRCLGHTFSALILQPGKQKGWFKALTENYLTVSVFGRFKQNDRVLVRLKGLDPIIGLIGERYV
ncbi:MAG: tRNA (N(6)-L-threonylcarbamoyladenosine(37)-C(2))-methylthiotransferase MtaB [Desulfobacca sp.]|nr:tRNA (N(6)-L-threonylcarbamoyladenosine(37)-C(2))-methylthiotransferase MtaB [Desulfobacca sp.]